MDFMQYLQQLLGQQQYQQPYNPMAPRSVPYADPTGGKYTQQALGMSGQPYQRPSGIQPSGPPMMFDPNSPFGGLLGGGRNQNIPQVAIDRWGGGGMLGGLMGGAR